MYEASNVVEQGLLRARLACGAGAIAASHRRTSLPHRSVQEAQG